MYLGHLDCGDNRAAGFGEILRESERWSTMNGVVDRPFLSGEQHTGAERKRIRISISELAVLNCCRSCIWERLPIERLVNIFGWGALLVDASALQLLEFS